MVCLILICIYTNLSIALETFTIRQKLAETKQLQKDKNVFV